MRMDTSQLEQSILTVFFLVICAGEIVHSISPDVECQIVDHIEETDPYNRDLYPEFVRLSKCKGGRKLRSGYQCQGTMNTITLRVWKITADREVDITMKTAASCKEVCVCGRKCNNPKPGICGRDYSWNKEQCKCTLKKCSNAIYLKDNFRIPSVNDRPMPLANVRADTLKKVLIWAMHYADDQCEGGQCEDDLMVPKNMFDIPDPRGLGFLKADQGTLFELIMAADYLNIRDLRDITCKKIASTIKGNLPEEIRETCYPQSDLILEDKEGEEQEEEEEEEEEEDRRFP